MRIFMSVICIISSALVVTACSSMNPTVTPEARTSNPTVTAANTPDITQMDLANLRAPASETATAVTAAPTAKTQLKPEDINYNEATTCTQVEADIENWINRAGQNTNPTLAKEIVSKAADRCSHILNTSAKAEAFKTQKADCQILKSTRSPASATDAMIQSQCVLSAGLTVEATK
jgi:hypothetical protein